MKQLIVLICLGALAACGGGSEQGSSAGSKASSASKPASSKLNAFLAEDKICDMISTEQLASLFATEQAIQTQGSSFRNTFSCSYTWDRADKAEREKAMMSNAMAAVRGEGPKLTMRDRSTQHTIQVSLQASKQDAATFVPRKLSDAEVQAQIDRAQKAANERMTDEQKELAGDAANEMVAAMLKKNNENQEIEGIGDAAYWSNLMTGFLEVLDGDVRMSVSPMVADTKEADLENAKKITNTILNN